MSYDFFGNSIALQQTNLQFVWDKMQINLHNISNVDTPNYKTKYATFEEEFRNRLTGAYRTGNDAKDYRQVIDTAKIKIHEVNYQSKREDGNNVDMNAEQIEVMRNSYQYNFLLKSINNDISRFKTALKTS